MQKSEFPKMRHYVGFWQIGLHLLTHLAICPGISETQNKAILCRTEQHHCPVNQ